MTTATQLVLAELHVHLEAYRAVIVEQTRAQGLGVLVDPAARREDQPWNREWTAVSALEVFVAALVDPENQPHQWAVAGDARQQLHPEAHGRATVD